MANKCDVTGYNYLATSGETKCLQHKPKPVPNSPTAAQDGFAWVNMTDVPTNARFNEAASKLFAAIKTGQPGHALRVSMSKFDKSDLHCAQRYALATGLRIGVRVTHDYGYLWKLTETEIKAVEQKGERLRAAREKIGKRGKGLAVAARK